MRIQRYIAKDMRSALAQVREALGPDAVILSSGTVGDEVEVVAAIDMEVVARGERAAGDARDAPARRLAAQERAHIRATPESIDRARAVTRSAPKRAAVPPSARRASSQLSESLAPVHAPQSPPPAPAAPTRRTLRSPK